MSDLTYVNIFIPLPFRMIKSRRMGWARHVARMEAKMSAYRLLVGKPEGKGSLGREDVGGWTILEWILER
jgi:hypothetical protein